MSKFTNFLNKSTSVTTDIVISLGCGAVAGLAADWIQLDALPLVGAFVPPSIAGLTAGGIYMRQRENLRRPAPAFMKPG
jgi:hypothetical protein